MLKLTKKTDYALMAINFMSCQSEDSIANTRTISEIYSIPLELLAKILQRLSKKGIIVSQNGPKGGYTLAKDPSQITVGEVIRAIEGPVHIVRCDEGTHCLQTERCTVRSPLRKIEGKIVDLLDKTTIDQMYRDDVIEEIHVG
ncbi:MAG: Rrf2 family transcriptional regulator [Candidatus Manganitrophaceae bacterium]